VHVVIEVVNRCVMFI